MLPLLPHSVFSDVEVAGRRHCADWFAATRLRKHLTRGSVTETDHVVSGGGEERTKAGQQERAK